MKFIPLLAALLLFSLSLSAAQSTYCNPLNLDYAYCPIPNFVKNGKHRTTADPVIVLFKGDYYLFSTNQWGYWWSSDMLHWNFVPRKFLRLEHKVFDELCAPAAWVMDDALYLIGSTHTKDFPIWMSRNPRKDEWTQAVEKFQGAAWDPAFFLDDDGRLYLYWGSSNTFPLFGREIDRKTLQPKSESRELIKLHDDQHGWERFGESNDNTFLRPFIEGAWMNKHNGRYYLQYAAPGTEFSGYCDAVYTSDKPLGPFTLQSHNPFSYKPGGFVRGAGHGATFQDKSGHWWHIATTVISVKNNFERRLGIFPAAFDHDGILYCNTTFGDYPTQLSSGKFTGWMLLNYNKPTTASSTLGALSANFAVDEDIKTHWSAKSADPGEWLQSDLGQLSTIRAIQINYADQDADLMGKVPGIFHRYKLHASRDGQSWTTIIDKSNNTADIPHDYIELETPIEARFVKLENLHIPTGKFAISGLRIFGLAPGKPPAAVEDFIALRGDSDRRNAWLKWKASPHATGYVIYVGTTPEKLYTSIMVYTANEYVFRAMTKNQIYYFQIEPFNESGRGPRSQVIEAK
jgi:hypothetical protein